MKIAIMQVMLLQELFNQTVNQKKEGYAIFGQPKEIVKPLIKKGIIHKETYQFTGGAALTEKGIAYVGNKGL